MTGSSRENPFEQALRVTDPEEKKRVLYLAFMEAAVEGFLSNPTVPLGELGTPRPKGTLTEIDRIKNAAEPLAAYFAAAGRNDSFPMLEITARHLQAVCANPQTSIHHLASHGSMVENMAVLRVASAVEISVGLVMSLR